MISVCLNWIVVTICSYVIGFAALTRLLSLPVLSSGTHGRPYSVRYHLSYILAGLSIITVYSQIFSLFAGVGPVSLFVLAALTLVSALSCREALAEDLSGIYRLVDNSGSFVLFLAIFLFMAYGTSHGLMHYDTDLYHAQAIHWIEVYGCVPGLGNLHNRFAYNSAAFPLSAVFSMAFTGKSTHAMAGYCALLLACSCADIRRMAGRGYPILADFVRLAAIYYLFGAFRELVSPATDTFVLSLSLLLIIKWLDLSAARERSYIPHALLGLFAVFLVTIKLSVLPLTLLCIQPLVRLFRRHADRALRVLCLFICASLIIVLPFFIRNIIISGYLLYPFPAIDLFGFDWKLPADAVAYDAAEITAYGRGGTDAALSSAPFSEWFPAWFKNLIPAYRIPLIFDLAALIPVLVCGISYTCLQLRRQRNAAADNSGKLLRLPRHRLIRLGDLLFLLGVLYIQLLFLLLTSPLPRYGGVFFWMPAAIMAGRLLLYIYELAEKRVISLKAHGGTHPLVLGRVLLAVSTLYCCYRAGMAIYTDIPAFRAAYLNEQQDYGTYDTEAVTVDGLTVYIPTEGDRTGYSPFPATPGYRIGSFELRQPGRPERGFKPTKPNG